MLMPGGAWLLSSTRSRAVDASSDAVGVDLWAIKCDIRRYFPFIDHRILRGQNGRMIGDPEAL